MDNIQQKSGKTAVLGIFAKQPLAGQCKTRLCPPLTLAAAAQFYQCVLQETINRMQAAGSYDLVICYAGERSWFEQTFAGVSLIQQQGADLGERMATALDTFLQQGYRQAVLIGSDAPDLPLERIEQAFSALQRVDVVIAPATDGGYVLIGESRHHPQLFADIAWGSERVMATTESLLRQHAIASRTLESWEDLDDLASLQRFLQRSPESKTAAYLRQHLSGYFQSIADM